jgi:hypothetical protein
MLEMQLCLKHKCSLSPSLNSIYTFKLIQRDLYLVNHYKIKFDKKERFNMLQIINASNTDEISAFLTTTLISHTYEVESTQSIVTLWDDLRKNVKLKDELDYVSAMLSTGRIMDLGIEIRDLNAYNTIITDIKTYLISRKIDSTEIQKELMAALIASADISKSEEVESIRNIVEVWIQIKDGIVIKDDLDLIAAILTTGRIMELKIRAGGLDFINNIFLNIRKELDQHASGITITQKEIAAAFITSAYIEISKKVEKIRDIVTTWLRICNQISLEDQWDYIAMILSTGKIKDMDAMHFIDNENMKDMNEKIRSQIKDIVGE